MKNANECQNCVIIYNRMTLPIITQHPSRYFSLDSSFLWCKLNFTKADIICYVKIKAS